MAVVTPKKAHRVRAKGLRTRIRGSREEFARLFNNPGDHPKSQEPGTGLEPAEPLIPHDDAWRDVAGGDFDPPRAFPRSRITRVPSRQVSEVDVGDYVPKELGWLGDL